MIFCIQASNPRILETLETYDESDNTLSAAIENSYPMRTEDAIMVWNDIYIPLSYKYDISYMMDDIIDLLKMLRENLNGELKIDWLPDTFRSDWLIKWENNEINIETNWGNTVSDLTNMLNIKSTITMGKSCFINEWKQLLCNVINALKKSYDKVGTIPKIKELIYEYSMIGNGGILY